MKRDMHEEDVLNDPRTSEWLRAALRAALVKDPVDVANEAAQLLQLLRERAARAHGTEERED